MSSLSSNCVKVATVVGARPQFIKAAPVSHAIRKIHDEVLIHTGQHYDQGMSQVFFDQLGIPHPDYNLGIGSGPHGVQTGRMLVALEETFVSVKPDVVVVFGDTNSTLAGALAASKLTIPVAHVEAGLRSFDRSMPEEVNRVLTDHVSDSLYCPTQQAVVHLSKEGIHRGVRLVGDVMVDAFDLHASRAPEVSEVVRRYGLTDGKFWLATIHRPSSTDRAETLERILKAFVRSGEDVLLAAHPRTQAAISRHGLERLTRAENLHVVPPLSYFDLLASLIASKGVVTDSGGLQKEAYLAGRLCITLRENTEWGETVEEGWNVLVGTDTERIVSAMNGFRPTTERAQLFGDGRASERIANTLGIKD